MMTRDVLLDMEQEEDDDEDGDIGEQGVPGAGPARGPASTPERPSPRGRKLGTARWRSTHRGGDLRGPSAAARSVGGRPGPGEGARATVRGRNAAASGRRPWSPPGSLAATDGPREGLGGAGHAGAPSTVSGRGRDAVTGDSGTPLRAEVLTQKQQLLGHFLRLVQALGRP